MNIRPAVKPVSARQAAFEAQLRTAERSLSRADPLLRRLVKRHGACQLAPQWRRTPYQALISAIIYQQLAGAAAATIHGRFLALFPGPGFPLPEQVLHMPEEKLRSAGLSRQKLSYIRDIAAKAHAGEVPVKRAALLRKSDAAVIEQLTAARGVGRWTVEMLLIFTLGRLDVLPVDDYGVRGGYARAAGLDALPAPRELAVIGERWAPYRSVASWYFWAEADGKA
jgi:DNA-3-methyladenine glycosylase II